MADSAKLRTQSGPAPGRRGPPAPRRASSWDDGDDGVDARAGGEHGAGTRGAADAAACEGAGATPAWWPSRDQLLAGSGYAGWAGDAVARVEAGIPPRQFFDEFVARRRPCIVSGLLTDPEFRAGRWTDAYLCAAAGGEPVRVEERESSAAAFGRGRKVRMPFGEFVRRAGSGDDSLYLSAQPLPEGTDGPTELFAPPLRGRLAADVPLRPRLLGRLVPQQLNVWMGSTKRPSSSGLHHDFHDKYSTISYCL
jgi:hypothetical protein